MFSKRYLGVAAPYVGEYGANKYQDQTRKTECDKRCQWKNSQQEFETRKTFGGFEFGASNTQDSAGKGGH